MSVAVVLKGYPRLSETFIAQEILSLEKSGLEIDLISLRHPTDPSSHPIHREIRGALNYLPEYLYQEPLRVFEAWLRVRKTPGYKKAWGPWIRDLRRDRSPNRIRRFGQALVLADELSSSTTLIYAHFLHTPSSVARYAALMRDLPWAFSAHAKDIWTTPDWEKNEKLADCAWAVTCTETGFQHLGELAPKGTDIKRIYHGLDLARFPDPGIKEGACNGQSRDQQVRILSVGRAVAKKGFDTMLAALARLPSDLYWHWRHVGGGSALAELKKQAAQLGLDEKISWLGPLPQEELLAIYRDSDLFILPSRIAKGGDRDGLPNVLMEAASQRLAIIATTLPGIREFIDSPTHGLLVAPDDPSALAAAITDAATHPEKRRAWEDAAFDRLYRDFTHANTIGALVGLIRRTDRDHS